MVWVFYEVSNNERPSLRLGCPNHSHLSFIRRSLNPIPREGVSIFLVAYGEKSFKSIQIIQIIFLFVICLICNDL